MSFTKRFGRTAGSIALESVEGAAVEGELLDADQQVGDGVDAALLEVQQDVVELEKNDAAVTELENTAIALESLLEGAEASLETGGLDVAAADMLARAVNNETAPLGTPAEEVVPALESFASTTDRRQVTVMACESIKDWIAGVWKRIRELIAKGRDFFKSLWVKMRQVVVGLQRRVGGLKKDLESRNPNAKKAGQVELANGKWADKNGSLSKTADYVTSVLTEYTPKAIAHAEAVAASFGAGKVEEAAAAAGTDAAGQEKAAAKEAKKELIVPAALENVTHTLSNGAKYLAGGYQFTQEAVGFSIQQGGAAEKAVDKYTAAPMAVSEIKSSLETLEALAKTVVDFERAFQKRDEAARKVMEAGDKFAKEAKKNDQKNEGDVRAAINGAKDAAYLLDKPIRSTLTYATAFINGSCSFLSAHIKHYDKK